MDCTNNRAFFALNVQTNEKSSIHANECLFSCNEQQKVYLTNRFHVAVRLFSNRSQMTSKSGKNKKVAHEATWNLFVLYIKKLKHRKNALLFQILPL